MTIRPHHRRRADQRGVALIIVLGSVALAIIVAGMLISSSQTTGIIAKVNVDRSRGKYAGESALAFAQWMVISDRRQFPGNRRLGIPNLQRDEYDEPAWMADGRTHVVHLPDDMIAEIRVLDASSGWDFASPSMIRVVRQQLLRPIDEEEAQDTERRDEISAFFDALEDYLDPDDLHRLHGMERDQWEAEGLKRFPRNNKLSFREEVYWIYGVEKLVPRLAGGDNVLPPQDVIRIIAPPGVERFTGKPAFFSSTPEMIQAVAGLTHEELQFVLQCRDEWYDNEMALADCLDDVYGRINSTMLLSESGVYTFEIHARDHLGEIGRTLVATIDLRTLPADYLTYWQKIFY